MIQISKEDARKGFIKEAKDCYIAQANDYHMSCGEEGCTHEEMIRKLNSYRESFKTFIGAIND